MLKLIHLISHNIYSVIIIEQVKLQFTDSSSTVNHNISFNAVLNLIKIIIFDRVFVFTISKNLNIVLLTLNKLDHLPNIFSNHTSNIIFYKQIGMSVFITRCYICLPFQNLLPNVNLSTFNFIQQYNINNYLKIDMFHFVPINFVQKEAKKLACRQCKHIFY